MTGTRKIYVRGAFVALGATALAIGVSSGAALAQPESFEFNGGEAETYTVPAGVCSLEVTALGAEGGSDAEGTPAGLGGEITSRVPVQPGEVLSVVVGGAGGDADGPAPGAGGANGGADGGAADGFQTVPGLEGGGGGGGASSVESAAGDRLVVAGGGGGSGAFNTSGNNSGGGAGGGGDGQDGFALDVPAEGGLGGTDSAGGAGGRGGGIGLAFGDDGESGDVDGVGTGGTGGSDGDPQTPGQGVGGGGGGGGYHGGGGGGGSNSVAASTAGGGGGGSSFAVGEILAEDPGVQEGDGSVLITPIENTCPVEAAVIRFTG